MVNNLERIKNEKSVYKHIKILTRALACDEIIVFTRYSDGELYMLFEKEIRLTGEGAWIDGVKVNDQVYEEHDRKTYIPGRDSKIIKMLRDAYNYKSNTYLVGMPLQCCVGEEMFSELKKTEGIPYNYTTSNLLINANYPYFLEKTMKIVKRKKIVLIANSRANYSQLGNVIGFIGIGDDCGQQIDQIKESLDAMLSRHPIREGMIILCAASYISNILGHHVDAKYKDISFLDIGTALHPQMGFGISRDYLYKYWSDPKGYNYHQCEID